MKKINPFKLFACLIGGFFLSLALIVSIMINIIWQVNSLDYHTYTSVDAFKESELTPFYNMYDAYEYIFNDKEILMSDKQHYIIDYHYPNEYFMKDVGSAKVNARYAIQFRSPDGALNYYEHNEPFYMGHLYISRSYDYPNGIEFAYVHESKPLYYTVWLTIINDDINIYDYIDKIKDYVLLTEKYNK